MWWKNLKVGLVRPLCFGDLLLPSRSLSAYVSSHDIQSSVINKWSSKTGECDAGEALELTSVDPLYRRLCHYYHCWCGRRRSQGASSIRRAQDSHRDTDGAVSSRYDLDTRDMNEGLYSSGFLGGIGTFLRPSQKSASLYVYQRCIPL